ncbi:DUF6708 domain-containing protein [Cupriavidus sp. 2TAF22]|uniref:DUF6708 domain-containing protein n=1 Tax=unclassified Cupriavidus TaxID=2640874 RepID=UPI003F937F97
MPDLQRRPTLAEIQRKWRQFRSASNLLSSEINPNSIPGISILRKSEHGIELISETMQRNNEGLTLRISLLLSITLILGATLSHSRDNTTYFLVISLSCLAFGFSGFLSARLIGPRFRYRSSRVRINRKTQKIYYSPYPEEGNEELLVMEWNHIQALAYSTGRSAPYLYLIGYTSNTPEPKLAKIPIVADYRISIDSVLVLPTDCRWAWLQRYMTGDPSLPAPTVESPPRSWRDVLLRYGGRWVLASFTDPNRRWWLPLTLWVDLAIVLLVMPVMALPQLIILTYPEPQFPPENDRLCGFADEERNDRA